MEQWEATWGWWTFSFYPHQRTFFSLLWEREEEGLGWGERERQREISIGHLVICDQESNPQPGYVPRLGIEPTTFQSTRGCSNQLNHTGQGSAVDLLTQTNSQWRINYGTSHYKTKLLDSIHGGLEPELRARGSVSNPGSATQQLQVGHITSLSLGFLINNLDLCEVWDTAPHTE